MHEGLEQAYVRGDRGMSDRPSHEGFGAGQHQAAHVLTLAVGFTAAVIGFWLLGRFVDRWLHIDPWAQVVGALVGWGVGFVHVYVGTQKK